MSVVVKHNIAAVVSPPKDEDEDFIEEFDEEGHQAHFRPHKDDLVIFAEAANLWEENQKKL